MSKDPEAQYFGVLLVSGSHPCVVLQPGPTQAGLRLTRL